MPRYPLRRLVEQHPDELPGATALCGTREGLPRAEFRAALEAEDFDAVLRRLPISAGRTVYVPGGTPHSLGPDTLVYTRLGEIPEPERGAG